MIDKEYNPNQRIESFFRKMGINIKNELSFTFLISKPKTKEIKSMYSIRDIYFSFIYYQVIEYSDYTYQCSCPFYNDLEKKLNYLVKSKQSLLQKYRNKNRLTRIRANQIERDYKILKENIEDVYCPHIYNINQLPLEFKLNQYITLRLENKITKIYINEKEFISCKYLLIRNPHINPIQKDIDSIDEAKAYLRDDLEHKKIEIKPIDEFWGHASNLQAWVEHDYDTRILHSNLAFPLLKRLVEVGDLKAKKVFKEEIIKRLQSGFIPTIQYLLCENYISVRYFTKEELEIIVELLPKNLQNQKYINKLL